MNHLLLQIVAIALVSTGLSARTAVAQTTDGFHTIQVFPVVVDTPSFTQRFSFRNPNTSPVSITPSYFPADGTAQATPLDCPAFQIAAGSDRTFVSLRDICPALPAGSNFGFLYSYETSAENLLYSAFSRVSNPQGNGFSVEAFAPNTFTSAATVLTGVRRLAATASSPAYQTNCFAANIREVTPGAASSINVIAQVFTSTGALLGGVVFPLAPGAQTRLLDVFAAVNAPAGDYNDARVVITPLTNGQSIMSFCTVQDNTSFGADFRIGKQITRIGGEGQGLGPQDDHVARTASVNYDGRLGEFGTNFLWRSFNLRTGPLVANTHVVYFKHPDWVQCEILNPATLLRALPDYGMEMRMMGPDGLTTLAGGNGSTGFGKIYLGDKQDRNQGANTRYSIEVENTGTLATQRNYRLRCQSGSGSTLLDIVRYWEEVDRF